MIESIIQIKKAYNLMRLFVNENAVKLKLSRPRPGSAGGAFSAPSNPLADVIGCNSCGVLYSL